jgi:hypothetical protein
LHVEEQAAIKKEGEGEGEEEEVEEVEEEEEVYVSDDDEVMTDEGIEAYLLRQYYSGKMTLEEYQDSLRWARDAKKKGGKNWTKGGWKQHSRHMQQLEAQNVLKAAEKLFLLARASVLAIVGEGSVEGAKEGWEGVDVSQQLDTWRMEYVVRRHILKSPQYCD